MAGAIPDIIERKKRIDLGQIWHGVFVCVLTILFWSGVAVAAELSGGRSVQLERDGACGPGDVRTRYNLSATLTYTNEDACSGRTAAFCTDYLKGYLVDGTNKIIGDNKYAVFQGQKSLISLGIDITGVPKRAPFKFIIVDVINATAGQSTGQTYAGNTTYQTELFSRTFDPSKSDADCPKPVSDEGVEKQVQNLIDQSKNKTITTPALSVKPVPVVNKTITTPALSVKPVPVVNKTITTPALSVKPVPVVNKTITTPALSVNPTSQVNRTIATPALSVKPVPVVNKTITTPALKVGRVKEDLEERVAELDPNAAQEGVQKASNPGDVSLHKDGVCGDGFPRTQFRMKASILHTKDDSCWGRGDVYCSDYMNSYIVDADGKILGKSKSATTKGKKQAASRVDWLFTVPVFLSSTRAPYRFVLSDASGFTAAQNPGDIYVPNNSFQKEMLSKSFEPASLDQDCPRVAKSDDGLEERVAELPPAGDKTIDLGVMRMSGAAPGQDKTVDLGVMRISGAAPGEDKTVDLGVMRMSGAAPGEDKTVDLGVMRMSGAAPGEDKTVDLGVMRMSGAAPGQDKTVDLGVMRMSGAAPKRTTPTTRSSRLPKRVKVSLVRVRKISGETNPFDPVEVEADVTAAQEGTLNQTASNATALTLASTIPSPLPFAFCCNTIFINIDDLGVNTLSTEDFNSTQSAFNVGTNGIGGMIYNVEPDFTFVSRTLPNPVAQNTQVTFVVRRNSDNNFFQVTFSGSVDANLDLRVETLSGFNCGTSAGNCP